MPRAGRRRRFLFFAADPDFQVAVLDDPRAYPRSTTRYRQTVVACSGPKARYAVSVFEVARRAPARPGLPRRARRPGPLVGLGPDEPGPRVAPAADDPVPRQRPGRGRPLVRPGLRRVRPDEPTARRPRPTTGRPWPSPAGPGVRLHLLGDAPFAVVTGSTPRARLGRRPRPVGPDPPPDARRTGRRSNRRSSPSSSRSGPARPRQGRPDDRDARLRRPLPRDRSTAPSTWSSTSGRARSGPSSSPTAAT